MPQHNTKRTKLAYGWLRGEDFWGDPTSNNTVTTDMLLHPYILTMTLTEPPAFELGDMHIVGAGGEGDWAGHDNELAIITENGWFFFAPFKGVRIRVENPAGWQWWDGSAWIGEEVIDSTIPIQGTRYDIQMSVGYEAEPRETLLIMPMPQAMTLPAGATGSKARCTTPPISVMVLSIRRNATEVGTISFSPASMFGTFAVSANVLFAEDDLLTIVVSDNPPQGFEDYGVLIRMLLAQT